MDLTTTPLTPGKTLFNEEAVSHEEVFFDEDLLLDEGVYSNKEAISNEETLPNDEMLFAQMLIREKPRLLYQAHKNQIHTFWNNLEMDTSIAGDSCLADAYKAIRVVDDIISDESLDYWKHRLAYIQLQNLLASLNVIILHEKRNWHIEGRRGHGNNTIKYEILSKALEGRSSANTIRRRVRCSRRWSLIIGRSMLLAIAYSGKAETYV